MFTNITNTDEERKSNGTHLQGHINVSYDKLRKTFGMHGHGDGYKIDAEWVIKFDDPFFEDKHDKELIATIYNWKDGYNYNQDELEYAIAVNNITHWHIGGHSKKAVLKIKEALA